MNNERLYDIVDKMSKIYFTKGRNGICTGEIKLMNFLEKIILSYFEIDSLIYCHNEYNHWDWRQQETINFSFYFLKQYQDTKLLRCTKIVFHLKTETLVELETKTIF